MRSSFKRLLSLCLCFALTLVLFPCSRVKATENDPLMYLSYSITGGTVTITDCDTSINGSLEIPDTIEGFPVTTIRDHAFLFCCNLTEVVMPNSVTEIGYFTFGGCSRLTKITLSNHLKTIPTFAFNGCALTEVIIPASVTYIAESAFQHAYALKSVIFLGDPPSFHPWAFTENLNKDSPSDPFLFSTFCGTVYYPIHNPKWTTNVMKDYDAKKISWVGRHSWDEGTPITAATCTTEGSYLHTCSVCGETKTETTPALGHSWDNGTVTSQPTCTQNGVLHYTCTVCSGTKEESIRATGHIWGDTTIITAPGCLEAGTLGYICSQCGTVGNHEPITATGHSYESTVEAATCTHPGQIIYTCTACGDVRQTEISPATGHSYVDGLCTVCGQTEALFSGACGADARWHLYENGTLRIRGTGSMDDFALSEDGTTPNTPWYPHRLQITKVVIDNGVTSIGEYAFHGCGSLTDIGIPETVTTIGKLAFYNCTGLTELTIPGSVTTIGSAAFRRCGNLTRITLSEGLTTIGKIAFFDCTGLTEVTIPGSVTTIGEYAFGNCTGLTAVAFSGSAPSMDSTCFKNVTATANHPCHDTTWTDTVKQSYGGTITWTASHSYETVTVDPTCTVPGSITTSCTACGDATVEPLCATGHSYENSICTACGVTLTGDINGDNTVDIADIACLYGHVNGTAPIVEEAQLLQADTNGDGTINIGDVAKLYAHIKDTTSLA